jgi:hypothetical protein
MTTRRDEFIATVLDADLQARRERHEARLRGEHGRMAQERARVLDAAIVAQREARISAWRAVAQAREAVS